MWNKRVRAANTRYKPLWNERVSRVIRDHRSLWNKRVSRAIRDHRSLWNERVRWAKGVIVLGGVSELDEPTLAVVLRGILSDLGEP